MAIPPHGWVEPIFGELWDFQLPEDYIITYRDTFVFGKVSGVVVRQAGHAFVENKSGFRRINLEIHITSVHDVILVDRIE